MQHFVVRAPPGDEFDVQLALDVHEGAGTNDAHSHHYHRDPEGPVQVAIGDVFCSAVDELMDGPDDAGEGDKREDEIGDDLASLSFGHVQAFPLRTHVH